MYISLNTTFTQEQLANDWEVVKDYGDNIIAYRSKQPNGLLRIIDMDSMHDILEFIGNPHTIDMADAKTKSDKIMGV